MESQTVPAMRTINTHDDEDAYMLTTNGAEDEIVDLTVIKSKAVHILKPSSDLLTVSYPLHLLLLCKLLIL